MHNARPSFGGETGGISILGLSNLRGYFVKRFLSFVGRDQLRPKVRDQSAENQSEDEDEDEDEEDEEKVRMKMIISEFELENEKPFIHYTTSTF